MLKLYKGVVEDNIDPKKLNRVRVRIFGVHSEILSSVPTNTLPWAEVDTPTIFGGLHQGKGISSVLSNGTWVRIIIEDDDFESPLITGTINGTHTFKDEGIGFTDPNKVYPIENRLKEPDTNEITRGNINNTVIKTKNNNLDNSEVYTEVAQNISTYTNNNVIETNSGHMIELDDTVGNERVQIIDKNGNYSEMKVNEYIDKAVADKVNLIMGDLKEHIKKDVMKYVEGNVTEHIVKDNILNIDGNLAINIGGTCDITSAGNMTLTGARIDLN